MSWQNYKSSLLTETAEQRETRRLRERAEREAEEHRRLQDQLDLDRQKFEAEKKRREEADLLELERMAADKLIAEQRLRDFDVLQQRDMKKYESEHALEQQKLDRMIAVSQVELEASTLAVQADMARELREKEQQRAEESRRIMEEQSRNPLGLLNPAEWKPYEFVNESQTIRPPASDTPPSYAESQKKQDAAMLKSGGVSALHHDTFALQPVIADTSYIPTKEDVQPGERYPRCSSCFDEIKPDIERQKSGRCCKIKSSYYHSECYFTKAAPHCNHCGFTLYSHPQRNLSGTWGIFEGKKYHVECYQTQAGPRCCLCFDVVFANKEKNLSGFWRKGSNGKYFHEECFQKYQRMLLESGTITERDMLL